MAMMCDNCGKGIMYGNLVSHAKNRTKRTFKPNLHKKTILFNGKKLNGKFCTKCIKLFKKAETARKEVLEQPAVVSA